MENVIISNFVIPIACSIIGAIIFWVLTFRMSYTNVVFSHKLEHFYHDGKWRTRYQIANVGQHDLLDVDVIAIVEMVSEKHVARRYAILRSGDFNKLPILVGRRHTKPYWRMYKLDLFIDDVTLTELSQDHYPEVIRSKAKARTLTLEDILDYYQDQVHISIYVCGTDSFTGARKMFTSPVYTSGDIIHGNFLTKYDYSTHRELKKWINVVKPNEGADVIVGDEGQ